MFLQKQSLVSLFDKVQQYTTRRSPKNASKLCFSIGNRKIVDVIPDKAYFGVGTYFRIGIVSNEYRL